MKKRLILILTLIAIFIFSIVTTGYFLYISLLSYKKINIILPFAVKDINKIFVDYHNNPSNPNLEYKDESFTLGLPYQFELAYSGITEVQIIDKIVKKDIDLNDLEYYFDLKIEYVIEKKGK